MLFTKKGLKKKNLKKVTRTREIRVLNELIKNIEKREEKAPKFNETINERIKKKRRPTTSFPPFLEL